jgi:hypothetical protein
MLFILFLTPSRKKGKRFEPINLENAYKVIMRLTINSVSQNDFGSYRCVSKNSLGDTDGSIKLYREYKKWLGIFRNSHFIIITYYLIITVMLSHTVSSRFPSFLSIVYVQEEKRDKIPFHLAMELVYLRHNLWGGRNVGSWWGWKVFE